MVAAWVLGNVDPSNFVPDTASGFPFDSGTSCYAEVDCVCTDLRWYRSGTDPNQKPANLQLWNAETAEILATVSPVPDNGGIGWQEAALDPPIEILGHIRLMVTAAWRDYLQDPIWFPTHIPPPNFPAILGSFPALYNPGSGGGLPTTLGTGWLIGQDARFATVAPSGGGTLLAETSFTTAIKWVQEADYYLITVTTSPQTRYERDADGVIISRLIGSWSPLEGDYAGQRYQMDYKQMKLILPSGQHMTGVSVALLQGAEATLQAWSIGT